MAHEIRTPLHQVVGFIELLASSPLNSEQADFVRMLQSSTNTLMAIINDLLDFTKLEAGKMKLETIPFEVRNVLDGSVAAVLPQAEDKGLKIACDVGHGIPVKLLGDPNRLRQVVLNMLTNAIKFTSNGSITTTVRQVAAMTDPETSAEDKSSADPASAGSYDGNKESGIDATKSSKSASAAGGERSSKNLNMTIKRQVLLRFEVKDTGIGMTDDQCGRIFNAYQQADASVARNFGGTGLGLAICKSLVKSMGGAIGVKSVIGEGTTFWFEIPYQRHVLSRCSVVSDSTDTVIAGAASETDSRGVVDGVGVVPTVVSSKESRRERGTLVGGPETATTSASSTILSVSSPNTDTSTKCEEFRVLVAEDNKINQKVIRNMLKRLGHHATIVENGEEAVAKLCQVSDATDDNDATDQQDDTRLNDTIDGQRIREFDIVLMDWQMPVMDGIDATKEIRSHGWAEAELPIVGLTASIQSIDWKQVGMNDCLKKPIRIADLQSALIKYAARDDSGSAQAAYSSGVAAEVAAVAAQ